MLYIHKYKKVIIFDNKGKMLSMNCTYMEMLELGNNEM